MAAWRTLTELAHFLIARGQAGREALLSPATAHLVGIKLETAEAKPDRDEIALMICRRKETDRCSEPCFECKGRANIIVRAYGHTTHGRKPAA